MSNMSYCRFENALEDLEDCFDHISDDGLSETEDRCRKTMIELAKEITDQYGDMYDEP
ncbi:MAG: hypothetical protein AABN95_16225 [Acidobacteriota bacterium]